MPWQITRSIMVWAVLLLACRAQAADFFQPVQPPRVFQVMAHRGAKNIAPENTRPAIEYAAEDGFEWVEVDVRLTKDGKHVLLHNGSVDGITDGKGKVQDLTLEEIKKLDAGAWFAPAFAGERILTLSECLALCKNKVNLYLDCKQVNPELLAEEVLAAQMENQVVAFDDPENSAKIQAHSQGKVPIMLKWHPKDGQEEWTGKWHPDAVEIDAEEVTPAICGWFHWKNIKVQAKVLDEADRPEVWDAMLAAGVDWLQTDRSEDIIAQRCWKSLEKRPVRISCHRGANRYAPENTLPAFEKAILLGADYVEIDVRTSKDGQYFLLHDGNLDRTTNGKGPIADLDLGQIAVLDAGSWFGPAYRGLKIPTFDELIQLVKGHTQLYVDAKSIPAEALARILTEQQLLDKAVVYQGPDYIEKLHAINPDIRGLCPLGDAADIDTLAERVKPYGFDTKWEILSEALIAKCHAKGIQVFSDAMDTHERIEDYQQAMDWGIDVIQTDFPLRVMRAVELRRRGVAEPAASNENPEDAPPRERRHLCRPMFCEAVRDADALGGYMVGFQ